MVLVVPRGQQGIHGAAESQAFSQLSHNPGVTDILCRLVLLGVLPALHERDLPAFGAALFEFNRRVGELFRPWQGGVYAHPQSEAIVAYLRGQGIVGVGQSSWGPALFAVTDAGRAAAIAPQLRTHFALSPHEVVITEADNRGATVETEPAS